MSNICTSTPSIPTGIASCNNSPLQNQVFTSEAHYYIFTPIRCQSDGILQQLGHVDGVRWAIGNIGFNAGYGYNGLYIIPDTYSSCEGFNAARLLDYRTRATNLVLVIQSFIFSDMQSIWLNPTALASFVSDIVNFVVTNNFDEVEFDFEGWFPGGGSTSADWTNYKALLNQMGALLHAQGKKLSAAIPAIRNATAQTFYTNFVYAELNALAVDYYMLMNYDFMYGATSSISVSPDATAMDCLDFLRLNVPSSKIIGGIANYGYRTPDTASPVVVETLYREDINALIPNDVKYAVRADDSYELSIQRGGYWYKFPDEATISRRRVMYQNNGIGKVASWSLNTNTLFNI